MSKLSRFPVASRALLAGLIGAAALAAAVPAQAEILVTMTRQGNFSGFGAGGTLMPLKPDGATQTPAFNVPAGGRFIVSYSAECSNDAPGTTSWVTLEIRAVNVNTGAVKVLPPTNTAGGQDAFCTSNGTAGHDGWATQTVIATGVQLPAGNYRIQVLARTVNGGTGWLSDSSLVVWR
ncbi:hypothetical protein [uncultured Azohydromonas sp.]|jgi:hypothetical protein|uniref:hypothetical protein n=1 Tax=uncultured Azohydromonas sp. TaxID=487342 RepID=UPI002611D714|nr:hypothetical protein [uncultured Azohydromonas sp.]